MNLTDGMISPVQVLKHVRGFYYLGRLKYWADGRGRVGEGVWMAIDTPYVTYDNYSDAYTALVKSL